MTEIRFVRATNSDLETIHRLVDAALREHQGLQLLLHSSDVDLNDVELNYHARSGNFELLAAPDGQVLGVLGWRPAGRAVVELKKLYLAGSARGQGLGRLALERVATAALLLDARAIVLETSEALVAANRLYARFGFEKVMGDAAASFACLSEQCDLAYRLDLDRHYAGGGQAAAARTEIAIYETVHSVADYYDGPRIGVADFGGLPHFYDCRWDYSLDRWEDSFRLSPVSCETLALVQEEWDIWRRWEKAFAAGETSQETHPALPADRLRFEELQRLMAGRLVHLPEKQFRAKGEFRRANTRSTWEARWSPITP